MSETKENSIKEAGGCASGFRGKFYNFNADAEAKLDSALMAVGKFVQGESGCLLGHIKAAVVNDNGEGITLNLIDMDNGVEHHGTIPRSDVVNFDFMCAVLDVDEDELTHKMLHAIDDSGIDYFIDKGSLGHHHHHHGDGECDDPNCDCHKHHHHHGDGECDDPNCDCHKHHHHHGDGECDDPNCDCHKHHHHHGDGECDDPNCDCHKHHHHHGDGECDDPNCDCHKHHHDFASMIDENGHFVHHHHDDDHEHGHDEKEHCHCYCHSDEKDDKKKEEKPARKGFLSRFRKH